jgi:hypothetical protein
MCSLHGCSRGMFGSCLVFFLFWSWGFDTDCLWGVDKGLDGTEVVEYVFFVLSRFLFFFFFCICLFFIIIIMLHLGI